MSIPMLFAGGAVGPSIFAFVRIEVTAASGAWQGENTRRGGIGSISIQGGFVAGSYSATQYSRSDQEAVHTRLNGEQKSL